MQLKKILLFLYITLTPVHNIFSQIINGTDTLYGNEWVNFSQSYLKLTISSDGIYRVPFSTLNNAGVPLNTVTGRQFRLFRMGKEIPIYVSSETTLSNNDFVEFYATKNKSELDAYMYRTGSSGVLNPDFSLITDTMSYFLTWVNDASIGKRIKLQENNLSNPPAKEPWFWYSDKFTYNQQDIQYKYGDVYIPEFSTGEGYGSALAKDFVLAITPQFLVNTEGGQLTVRWTNQQYSIPTLSLNGELLAKDTINSFTLTEKNINLSAEKMKPTMNIALSGTYSDIDRQSVGLVQLTYARQFNFGNQPYFEFNIEPSDVNKYLEIDNFNSNNIAPILFDITNNLRLVSTLESGKIKVVLPPSSTKRKLILFNANTGYKTISTLEKINFKDFKNINAEYIIISSDKYISAGVTTEYANYRQSAAGGSYQTTIINIKDLYDQFGYGVQRHPMAIRDFSHFIKKNWQNPKFIVLMGKAREYNIVRTTAQLNAQISTYDIPTWGYPGSDILMVASNSSNRPIIPIGRIAASSITDVQNYLQKIKDLESTQKNAAQTVQEREPFKHILHLSGGGTVGEAIKFQLKSYENTLKTGKFGASVSTFYKNSTDPVEIAQNDKIFDRINQGLSLITFFGHSATSILEFDVNNPNLLNNKGKTPVFVALGCSAGNMHQQNIGVSENFIFYPNKGMSAFVGTTGTSYLSSLSNFGNNFYDLIANSQYGSELGNIVQKSIEKTGDNISPDVRSIIQAFAINGDPAIKITTAPGPDYIVDASSVKINPTLVTAQIDSINIQFDLLNIGTTVNDSIKIAFKQQSPNGAIADLKTVKVPTPQYKSNFDIKIPLAKTESVGVNRLFISLDTDNKIAELPAPSAESNNEYLDPTGKRGFEFLILANNILPAYPAHFSIIGKAPVVLKASTSNPLAATQNYFFEIDTTQLFNSPFKRTTTVNSKGGVIKWQPNIEYTDSTVYYWRAAVETSNGALTNWQNSSFTYITGKSGWSQGHYFQFVNNQFADMKANDGTREIEYSDDNLVLEIKGDPDDSRFYPSLFISSQYKIDNPLIYVNNPNSCFSITVFDGDNKYGDGSTWLNEPFNTLGYGYGFRVPFKNTGFPILFNFDASKPDPLIGRQGAIEFIKNVIPNNKWVLFYANLRNGGYRHNTNAWLNDSIIYGNNIFQILESQGAKLIRKLVSQDSTHYFILFKKNANSVLAEKVQSVYNDGINETFTLPRKWYTGTQSTQLIGPSKKWDKLDLNYTTGIGDTIGVDIIGISDNKIETILKRDITTNNTNLAEIDATKYPYLKLKYTSRDIRQQTPPQLKSWRIYYQGLPDLAVNPIVNYNKYTDTIQQGDKFTLSVGVENLSDYNADSVAVALTLKNDKNQEVLLQKKIQPIDAGKSAIAPFEYNTRPLEGKQQVFFEVNPKLVQPESITANNFLQTNITVQTDKTNPLLDVTFDGLRILNNDIVSSKPKIVIQLRDDNKFLALNDTNLFKLSIEPISPSGTARNINFTDPSVKFTPASNGNNIENKAIIELNPDFLKDGSYRLVVSGRDATGNNSGNINYNVQFKVITKQSISNLLPYPNPFSTATRFAYTLTGEAPPQYMTIQIMTISGKIVREITQNEIGQLKLAHI